MESGWRLVGDRFGLYFTVIQFPVVALRLNLGPAFKTCQRDLALYFSGIELPRSQSGGSLTI